MALPPEKISVKRRREEAPIETFFLEEKHRAKKSRLDAATPGYQFKLIRGGALLPKSRQQQADTNDSAREESSNGIPPVRTTAPGDEVADFAKFSRLQQASAASSELSEAPSSDLRETISSSAKSEGPIAPHARRFHLTHNLSSSHNVATMSAPTRTTGRNSAIRPPLPTFIERQQASAVSSAQLADGGRNDKELTKEGDQFASPAIAGDSVQSVGNASSSSNTGVSLDDPSQTWNRNSDQLADELAALAMDMDPDHKSLPAFEPTSTTINSVQKPRHEDEFIYETYIRLPYDSTEDAAMVDAPHPNIGVLVIEEEDEELWQEYMESDEEDDDWDDNDSNAEDNPANDYPDEEVSTDDEYDRNAYRYHKEYDNDFASDDEY